MKRVSQINAVVELVKNGATILKPTGSGFYKLSCESTLKSGLKTPKGGVS